MNTAEFPIYVCKRIWAEDNLRQAIILGVIGWGIIIASLILILR